MKQTIHAIAAKLSQLATWTIRLALLLLLTVSGFGALPALADNYAKEILINQDFSGRDLRDSNFTKANLLRVNFSHADLRGVSFFAANLEAGNLEGADFRSATLDSARFVDANLTNANLEGAFAFSAQFQGATIDGADFTDVDLRDDTQAMLCQIAKGTNPVTKRNTRETLNCA
ncbi:MAG: pentapeptide repeat-containing protein [Aphanocapsa sp. GSE-SYN-MK-11-07L]|jgi:uncharacterized protein YjbI with pentapeptide repeats|nr:pentapeptide repeat-containing protein [Aphanocapsa sp. GSE-SYN-MK-11-07L]